MLGAQLNVIWIRERADVDHRSNGSSNIVVSVIGSPGSLLMWGQRQSRRPCRSRKGPSVLVLSELSRSPGGDF